MRVVDAHQGSGSGEGRRPPPAGDGRRHGDAQPGRTAPTYGMSCRPETFTPEPGFSAFTIVAAADVHAHVADRAVVEHQVTGLQLALRNVRAASVLRRGAVGQRDAGLGPGCEGQAGAVEGARSGRTPDVGLADLRHGVGDGGADPLLVGLLAGLLGLLLQRGDLGGGSSGGALRTVGPLLQHALARGEHADLALGDDASRGEPGDRLAGGGQALGPTVGVLGDDGDVGQEGLGVLGQRGGRRGRAAGGVVGVHREAGHLGLQPAREPALGGDLGGETGQARARLGQRLLRRVVAARDGVGLLGQVVGACLGGADGVGVGSSRGRARGGEGEATQGEGRGDSCCRSGKWACSDGAQERAVSSLSRRLPGQLTDSGPKNALPVLVVTW